METIHNSHLLPPDPHKTLSFSCLALQNPGLKDLKEDNAGELCILKECVLWWQDKPCHGAQGRLSTQNKQTSDCLSPDVEAQPFHSQWNFTSHRERMGASVHAGFLKLQ